MRTTLCVLIACLLCTATAIADGPEASVAGRYLAAERDHKIELFLRGSKLYGRIAWTRQARLLDVNNRDPTLRDRPVLGIEHIRGLVRGANGTWSGGSLYNPEDGKTYDAKLWLEEDGRLVIQGRPRIALFGALLGAMFGRISYQRETL